MSLMSPSTAVAVRRHAKGPQGRAAMNPLKILLSIAALWLGLGAIAHAGTVTYVYSDPQGTPLAEADANGNITATFDYRPYGVQALGAAPNGPGYTGHVNDPDTGLVYMQARYYDPVVGRFISTDPVGPSAGGVFNFNRFAYADSNPVMVTDPTGRRICNSAGTSPGCSELDRSIVHPGGQCCGVAANSDGGRESAKQSAAPARPAGQCDETCDDIRQTNATILKNQGRALKQAGIFGVKFIAINAFTDGLGKLFGRVVEFLPFRGISSEARTIASGHAFSKHSGEFADIGINTEEQFAKHIDSVIRNPTASRELERGRVAYWDAGSGTVVIRDPNSVDGGTAFIPTRGVDYFNGLK